MKTPNMIQILIIFLLCASGLFLTTGCNTCRDAGTACGSCVSKTACSAYDGSCVACDTCLRCTGCGGFISGCLDGCNAGCLSS